MENYIKYICSICKNKDKNLCNITTTVDKRTKCAFYERKEKPKRTVDKGCYVTADKHEPIMRGIV